MQKELYITGIWEYLLALYVYPSFQKNLGRPKPQWLIPGIWIVSTEKIHATSCWTLVVIKSMLYSPIIRLQREHGPCGADQFLYKNKFYFLNNPIEEEKNPNFEMRSLFISWWQACSNKMKYPQLDDKTQNLGLLIKHAYTSVC